jgi:hypothetical protein
LLKIEFTLQIGKLQLFCKPLATLIFAPFGIAQTSLALHSLFTKIIFNDFCSAWHSSNKFDSALAFHKNWIDR